MRMAIRLGQRHLGRTAPNPSVGCVIVKQGRVIGVGITASGGRPHAEVSALAMAGGDAQGACIYSTLEPCSHHGQTGPCVDAIVAAKIARVVIGSTDTNPLVNGGGITALREAGIEVITDICRQETDLLHAGFFSAQLKKRPLVTLKIATSADGKMALADGSSQWITGEDARRYGHLLRSNHDAVLVGSGTVLADDPLLTSRIDGLPSPIRIALDARLKTPLHSQLVATAKTQPFWLITSADQPPEALAPYRERGVIIHSLPLQQQRFDVAALLTHLAAEGITRLLVEAGPTLTTAFLQQQCVDQLYWFHAPLLIGNDGLAAFDPFNLPALSAAPRLKLAERFALGSDSGAVYRL